MSDEDRVSRTVKDLLHDRSLIELWCDKHNHLMGLLRTVFGFLNVCLAALVFSKVFGFI